jgi:ubiquinone/menaquinone biosynthesis C-methylase UbiE
MNERDYFNISKLIIDYRDKIILEIGGHIPVALIASAKASKWISTDINIDRLEVDENIIRPEWYQSMLSDASLICLKDQSVNIVYSINSFEHIINLKSCIDEIYRVLKPGGYFFSKFAPIWSSGKGHHTWVKYKNSIYSFNNNILPDWYHLAYDEEKIFEILKKKYNPTLSKKIVKYIFQSFDLNRYTDLEIEKLLKIKPFRNVFFYRIRSKSQPNNKLRDRINIRFPYIKDLRTNGYFFLLKKGKPSLQTILRARLILFGAFIKYKVIY